MIVQIPWDALGLLVAEVALVLLVSIIIVSFMLRRIKPAQMLRMGMSDERPTRIEVTPPQSGPRAGNGTLAALGLLVRRRAWRDRWLVA